MITCRKCEAGLRNRPEGITHEQAEWFRELVITTIEDIAADGLVTPNGLVAEVDDPDDWGSEMDLRRFDD